MGVSKVWACGVMLAAAELAGQPAADHPLHLLRSAVPRRRGTR